MSNPATQFQKGDDPRRNLNGRPKGKKNYVTLRELVLERIGKKKGMSAEDVELMKIENGFVLGLGGDYSFFKDDLDRAYGTATITSKAMIEHSGEVDINENIDNADIEAIAEKVAEELKKKKVDGESK